MGDLHNPGNGDVGLRDPGLREGVSRDQFPKDQFSRDPGLRDPIEEGRKLSGGEPPQPRAVGSPLPTGSAGSFGPGSPLGPGLPLGSPLGPPAGSGAGSPLGPPSPLGSGSPLGAGSPLSQEGEPPPRSLGPPPPGRGLSHALAAAAAMEVPSGVQKAVSAIRSALPWVQRILPLLDGNIGMAVSNMLVPPRHTPPPQPPPQPVNLTPVLTPMLAPIKESLTVLEVEQRELRGQIFEQNSSLKRVEDQLEMVREATDRNTLEQQELLEDLKTVGNKVNLFAVIALGLLGLSVLINIVLYLHISKVLP